MNASEKEQKIKELKKALRVNQQKQHSNFGKQGFGKLQAEFEKICKELDELRNS